MFSPVIDFSTDLFYNISMNSFNYFRPLASKIQRVPSKNQSLFSWSLFQVRQAGLSYSKQIQCMEQASYILQDGQSNHTNFKSDFKAYLKPLRPKGLSFWLQELADFPLFLFIYISLINVVFSQILVPFMEQTAILEEVKIGWTLCIQTLCVYLIYKGLLTYMASDPKQSSLLFWIVIMAVFALYLASIYLANQMTGTWIECPVILWLVLTGAWAFVSVKYFFKKEERT